MAAPIYRITVNQSDRDLLIHALNDYADTPHVAHGARAEQLANKLRNQPPVGNKFSRSRGG